MEKAKTEKEARGALRRAQDSRASAPATAARRTRFSCYAGNMKGAGRIYRQTFVDTGETEVRLGRVLTDRGTKYCGNPEHREYELYLVAE